MTTRLYSTALGTNYTAITEANGIATVTADIELTVDLAVATDRDSVLEALERFKLYILGTNFPPV